MTALAVWLGLMAVAALLIALAVQFQEYWPDVVREKPRTVLTPLIFVLVVAANTFVMLLARRARRASQSSRDGRGESPTH